MHLEVEDDFLKDLQIEGFDNLFTHIMKHKQRIKNETSPAILEFL